MRGANDKSTVDALADVGLEALATTWPAAESDVECESIVERVEHEWGGDR
ncbi:hypothetical protein [Kutzneria sp. NPDC051319]